MADDDQRRARAAARASWPVVRVTLAEEAAPDVRSLSPGKRVAMVWALTLDAWASAGRELPTYTRAHVPTRMIRRGHGGR